MVLKQLVIPGPEDKDKFLRYPLNSLFATNGVESLFLTMRKTWLLNTLGLLGFFAESIFRQYGIYSFHEWKINPALQDWKLTFGRPGSLRLVGRFDFLSASRKSRAARKYARSQILIRPKVNLRLYIREGTELELGQ